VQQPLLLGAVELQLLTVTVQLLVLTKQLQQLAVLLTLLLKNS